MDLRWKKLILEGVQRLISIRLWCDGICKVEILKDIRLLLPLSLCLNLFFFELLEDLKRIINDLLFITLISVK